MEKDMERDMEKKRVGDMGRSGLQVESVLATIDRGAFVGRGAKMSRLREVYASVQEGQSWIISIKGESGVGKTRMVMEFLDWAVAQGADVLSGRAFEAGGRWPYQPLLEMLELRCIRGNQMFPESQQNVLCDPLVGMLERVLTEMRTYMMDKNNQFAVEGQGKTEYKRLCESFTLLGQALAEKTPVVLFLDDIHWSDHASLDMLQYASRRWIESNTPILILLTLRTEALVMLPNFAFWLAHLERDQHVASFIVNPLTLEDTLDFVRAIATEEAQHLEGFARWLHTETGGQAFYIMELLKMLFEQGLLRARERQGGGWCIDFMSIVGNADALERMMLPGMRSVIAVRFKQLQPIARSLAAASAILGRSLPFEHLQYVANLNEQEAKDALNELLALRIFCKEGAYYFFAHEKVREFAYMDNAGALRIELHARALETLRNEAMPVALQAYHALAAGLYEQAFHLSMTSADTALRLFAYRDAITFYESALHVLMDQQVQEGAFLTISVPTIEHLYLQSGHIYEVLHERERACATYQSMFLLAKRMNIPSLIHVALCQLAMVTRYKVVSMQEQARMLFQEGVAVLADSSEVLVENEWQLAQLNFYRFDAGTALLYGERALRLARESHVPELVARTLSAFANIRMLVSAWEEVEALAEEARLFYEQQHNTIMEATCLVQIAQAKLSRNQPQESIIAARGAYLAFTQAEYRWGRIYAAYHLVTGLLDIGAYGEALLLAHRALALARAYNVALLLCLCLSALGRVQRALMDPIAAYALHREAMSIFPTDVPPLVLELLNAELCADCAIAGEWAEAQTYATQALLHRSNSTFLYGSLTRWYETEILVRTGCNMRAIADAEQLGKLIGQCSRYRIPYLRMQGVLALWRGEFEQTHLYLQEAGELAEEIGLLGECWLIEVARGELYLAQGDRTLARAAFGHARKIVYTLAEKIEDGLVRAKFLAAPQVQRILTRRR
jgi:predicted ATPase